MERTIDKHGQFLLIPDIEVNTWWTNPGLGDIACNILRMIGQETIGGRTPRQKRNVKRRRLRTVISNLIMMASHVTTHARQVIMGLGKSNVWRHIFADIFHRFTAVTE